MREWGEWNEEHASRRAREADHLIHCELLERGTTLRVRACSTRPIGSVGELITELSEGVANALCCWVWAASAGT